jgi:hypothetical protein
MALSLFVPAANQPIPKDVETNPKKARAWVESLPLTKNIESGGAVVNALVALNRGKISNEDRVAIVETYRPIINVLLDELDAIYAFATLPLQPKSLEAFELAHTLSIESAHPYKMLVLEKSAKLIGFGNKKSLPLPIHRCLSNALAVMIQSYKTYYPIPRGVWQEVNSLYLYADEQGIAGEVPDESSKSSIADLYFEMVMLSLADPYRLMHREVDRALEVLRQNRGLVELKLSAEGVDPQRAFVIALDADAAPRPLIQGNKPAEGAVMRLVDPSKLVERIHQRIKGATTTGGVNAAKSRAMHDLDDLMARLARLWGDPPKRQFRRNPSETGVALCAGIKAIAYFSELAANENPEADAAAIREGRTIPLLKIPQDPVSQLIGVEEWQVLNQSANGLRLHRASGGNVGVTVGEAVGVRFVGGRAWNVGVVRWLTLLDGNALEFGMELISPTGYSVSLAATTGSSGRTTPGVLLEASHPEIPPDTVLTIADTFADLREFELNDHGELSNVRAVTLVERTSKFDLFQFQQS